MINPYYQELDIANIRKLQTRQYQIILPLERDIPAESQTDAAVNITSVGHFMLISITASFSTLSLDDQQQVVDDGINHLFIQLVDGANQRVLFDNFVPASLFLSPGRRKSLPTQGDPSDPLRLEYPFIYTFNLNSQIIVKIRNDSNAENNIQMAFKGIRILARIDRT